MFDNVLQRDTAVETYKTGAKLCGNGGQNIDRGKLTAGIAGLA